MIRRGPAGVACAALLLLGSSADLVGQDPRIAPVLEAADLPWALDPSGWYGFENLAVLDASFSYAVPHRMLFVAWTASTMAIGRVVRWAPGRFTPWSCSSTTVCAAPLRERGRTRTGPAGSCATGGPPA